MSAGSSVESKTGPARSAEGPVRQEALYEAHGARLRRLCELLLGDREEAKEVVQEVFLKAHEASIRLRVPDDWGAWLTQVTLNACRDRRRAGWWMRFRHRTDRIDELPMSAPGPSPADSALSEETRRRIWLAFRVLPSRQREVFVLRYIEEWSTGEVAAALGLSTGSVKRHLFRAIRRLRSALGGTP
ncbi:MAG TPA: sigma-70 family RNA polymerase sigma factor [Candidatus Methylomirabilis sp.]|nr:sigma-70 family RNA polymerase sigma factor [Candidatus Methylomirabilis sp.]